MLGFKVSGHAPLRRSWKFELATSEDKGLVVVLFGFSCASAAMDDGWLSEDGGAEREANAGRNLNGGAAGHDSRVLLPPLATHGPYWC